VCLTFNLAKSVLWSHLLSSLLRTISSNVLLNEPRRVASCSSRSRSWSQAPPALPSASRSLYGYRGRRTKPHSEHITSIIEHATNHMPPDVAPHRRASISACPCYLGTEHPIGMPTLERAVMAICSFLESSQCTRMLAPRSRVPSVFVGGSPLTWTFPVG
jgi:hypothetical protein